jgi:hypothetical protein
MRVEPTGPGMILKRNVDGEAQRLDAIKPAVIKRIEKLGKMNDRRERYKTQANRTVRRKEKV